MKNIYRFFAFSSFALLGCSSGDYQVQDNLAGGIQAFEVVSDKGLIYSEYIDKIAQAETGEEKQQKIADLLLVMESNNVPLSVLGKNNSGRLDHVTYRAKIETTHMCNFNTKHALDDKQEHPGHNQTYALVTKQGRKMLHPQQVPTFINPGQEYDIEGYQLDDENILWDLTEFNANPTHTEAVAGGESGVTKEVLLIMGHHLDAPAKPFVNAMTLQQRLNKGHFKDFWQEQSGGRMNYRFTVVGWYDLPAGLCHGNNTDTELINQTSIEHPGIDISNFDEVVTYTNCKQENLSPDWQGMALGNPSIGVTVWMQFSGLLVNKLMADPMQDFEMVLSHELGHRLGLGHANLLYCQGSNLHGNCEKIEYGNKFDIMGRGIDGNHFSMNAKTALGWVPKAHIIDITQSGVFTISAMENTPTLPNMSTVPNMANIKMNSIKMFTVEFRDGSGYDSKMVSNSYRAQNTQGLFIYYNNQLLDMRQTESNWDTDASQVSLMLGSTWYEPMTGISINVVSKTNNEITFIVHYDPNRLCYRDDFTASVDIVPWNLWNGTFLMQKITVDWNNSAFCKEVSYQVVFDPIPTALQAYGNCYDIPSKNLDPTLPYQTGIVSWNKAGPRAGTNLCWVEIDPSNCPPSLAGNHLFSATVTNRYSGHAIQVTKNLPLYCGQHTKPSTGGTI